MNVNNGERKSQQQVLLNAAIQESLLSLGEPIMKTIQWHLRLNGISFDSNNTNVREFYDHLGKVVGNLADIVIEDVYSGLQEKLMTHSSGDSSHNSQNDNSADAITTLDQIEQLLLSVDGDFDGTMGKGVIEK